MNINTPGIRARYYRQADRQIENALEVVSVSGLEKIFKKEVIDYARL